MHQQIANNYGPVIYQQYCSLPPHVRAQVSPEQFTEDWLDRNVNNLSDNMLSIAASLVLGSFFGINA